MKHLGLMLLAGAGALLTGLIAAAGAAVWRRAWRRWRTVARLPAPSELLAGAGALVAGLSAAMLAVLAQQERQRWYNSASRLPTAGGRRQAGGHRRRG